LDGFSSYLGNKTTHVWLTQDLNPAIYIPGASSTKNTQQRRLLALLNPSQGQYMGQVALADAGGNANYNGLLVSTQHRFSGGFTFLANYTWSHCISEGDFNGDLRGSYYQNPFSRAADRGDCNYDIRHLFNASVVAVSHFGMRGLASHLLNNWQVAPLLRISSGMPVNVTSGKDNSLSAENLDRPNVVPGATLYPAQIGPSLQWINPAAFTPNPTGTFGNLGRDVLRAPGAINFDVALSRIFGLTERWKLEARGEGFNVINHANFNAPTASLSSANFGRITTAGDPRILQFALKLHF